MLLNSRFPVFTIRVKRAPKPDLVKPRPPAARRFYFTELAVPIVTAPVQATVEIHHAALTYYCRSKTR
jgi:hypothetical protein